MPKPYEVSLVSNTKGLVADMDKAGESVEDLAKDLQTLDREAGKSSLNGKTFDKVGDSAKDAGRGVDNLADKYQDLARTVSKSSDKMSRDVKDFGDTVDRESGSGFGRARAHVGEFREEALQNFSEVTSSFDGSMQSVLDLAQGTFGGLASAGGPIGLAAGGISVLLGGLFAGMSAAADAEAQKSTERIQKMFDDMAESGNNFASEDLIDQNIQDIVKDTEQYNAAIKDAKTLHLDLSTVLRANAGDTDALSKVQSTINEQMDKANKLQADSKNAYDANGQAAAVLYGQLGPLSGKYGDLARDTDSAINRVNAARDAMNNAGGAAQNVVPKLDAVGAAVNRLPSSHVINIDATTNAAQAKLDALKRQYNGNVISMIVDARTRAGNRVF
ncbi:hypothetical protein DOE76_13940 [Leifsonia sp. ku-ls]|nr:hypothetical protein DOE76_13940 [Leifsonia sp. ku-ls]